MSLEFPNRIDENKRFAKQGDLEYSVFSVHVTNPGDVPEWIRVAHPDRVLMDQDTYDTLVNKHIEWVFDDNNVLISCKTRAVDTATGGEAKTSD